MTAKMVLAHRTRSARQSTMHVRSLSVAQRPHLNAEQWGQGWGRRVALLNLAGALAHASVISHHVQEWLPAGIFFIVVTGLQVASAIWFGHFGVGTAKHRSFAISSALALNVFVVAVYVISRTTHMPFAPRVGAHGMEATAGVPLLPAQIEGIGFVDSFSLVAELLVIMHLVSALADKSRRYATDLLCLCSAGLVGAVSFNWL
jgi:hypothetical protein